MLEEEWPQDLAVNDVAAAVLARHHQPDEEEALGQRVKGNPEEKLIAKVLEDAEQGVCGPVHQPLGIVILYLALDGLDRGIGWVNEAD